MNGESLLLSLFFRPTPNESVAQMSSMMRWMLRAHLMPRDIETHGLVAAGDVEANRGRADAALAGDDSADGHAIAKVAVGHQRKIVSAAGADLACSSVLASWSPHTGMFVDVLHGIDSFLAVGWL